MQTHYCIAGFICEVLIFVNLRDTVSSLNLIPHNFFISARHCNTLCIWKSNTKINLWAWFLKTHKAAYICDLLCNNSTSVHNCDLEKIAIEINTLGKNIKLVKQIEITKWPQIPNLMMSKNICFFFQYHEVNVCYWFLFTLQ